MKKFFLALCSAILFSQLAIAAEPSCSEKAALHRLTGEVKYKFIRKCEDDIDSAKKKCAIQAADKGLMGEAKFDFINKCVFKETN